MPKEFVMAVYAIATLGALAVWFVALTLVMRTKSPPFQGRLATKLLAGGGLGLMYLAYRILMQVLRNLAL